MRQAARAGAAILVLDPRPVALPMPFRHFPILPQEIGSVFESALGLAENAPATGAEAAAEVKGRLAESRRPVILCGTDIVPASLPATAAMGASHLKASGKAAGLCYLLPGPNAVGAALFTEGAHTVDGMVKEIEAGRIRALVVVEMDLFHACPDRARLEKALDRLELLVVVDYIDQPTVHRANVFLPSGTVFEAGGIFVNQEGRAQEIRPAFKGGIPLSQITGGGHPPREFTSGVPGADPVPAWAVIAALAGEGQASPTPLGGLFPTLAALDACRPFPEAGVLLDSALGLTVRIPPPPEADAAGIDGAFELILTGQTFGTEELSAHSPCLRAAEAPPRAVMHEADAAALGLSDGDLIAIEGVSGRLSLPLRTVQNMAPGVLVIPRHRRLRWQVLGEGRRWLEKKRIRRG
ncbi:molybdopterin-dependent oxidoreductase [Desulfococcus sp.]|uniref:molybdopterin-dependent oxidoreductase n=1 Tax=Desulfococcus sp. TaxID=2025834 RepID=UPI003594920C